MDVVDDVDVDDEINALWMQCITSYSICNIHKFYYFITYLFLSNGLVCDKTGLSLLICAPMTRRKT